TASEAYLIVAGWACRYQLLADGARQITALLLPGDLASPGAGSCGAVEHIAALTAATVTAIPYGTIGDWLDRQPGLARDLWCLARREQAILRQWLTGLGRRDAYQRVAHLFCELRARLDAVRLVDGDRFILPLTQG